MLLNTLYVPTGKKLENMPQPLQYYIQSRKWEDYVQVQSARLDLVNEVRLSAE